MSDDVSPIQDIPSAPSSKEEGRGIVCDVSLVEAFIRTSDYNRYKVLKFVRREVYAQMRHIDEIRQGLDHEIDKMETVTPPQESGRDQEFGF